MKRHLQIHLSLLAAALAGATSSGCSSQSEESLAAQAPVTREEAQKTALAQAPGGTVREAELEKEKGRWIWSFDIARPGAAEITEVHVDARTGRVLTVETESPSDQAREKAEDAKRSGGRANP